MCVETPPWSKMIGDIVSIARYWLPKYNSDPVIFEALWALTMNYMLKASAAEEKRVADAVNS